MQISPVDHFPAGLNTTNIAKLERDGYVVNARIEFRINPNGSIEMEEIWRDIVPLKLASHSVSKLRFGLGNGAFGDSLLDIVVITGLGMTFQQELFPDYEERLRENAPNLPR